jgi:hypothetical protein
VNVKKRKIFFPAGNRLNPDWCSLHSSHFIDSATFQNDSEVIAISDSIQKPFLHSLRYVRSVYRAFHNSLHDYKRL